MDRGQDAIVDHRYWASAEDIANPWHLGRQTLPDVAPHLEGHTLLITEWGRDKVWDLPPDKRGYAGWHKDPRLTAEGYMAELARAETQWLEPFANIPGAAVFDAGARAWPYFEVNSLWPSIMARRTGAPQPEPPRVAPLGYPLPFRARVSQGFGPTHHAIDLAAEDWREFREFHGTPVLAMHDGPVWIGNDLDGYGLYIVIDDGQQYRSYYAHLSETTVPSGAYVKRGDTIGRVGYSGNCLPLGIRGTHLHVELLPKPTEWANGFGGRVNPETYWR
jgi:murein DD-endopeptidase MepM/ murein hydrolase activator NlpD